ncbi:MAG: hypothetical protein Q9184_007733 [Pyrenodesmia sp. 2 TL-2023]
MADPLSLSLRPWPSSDKTKESLPYLIARINEQKGSFRNVTEASLEEEIRAAEAGGAQPTDDEEEGQNSKAKEDELLKAREQIIQEVGAAYAASSHALDFISLLLSKYDSKAAEATISPHVKGTVPLGSLGAEKMQEPSRSEAQEHTEELVGLGWRLQSLTRSADSLLSSALRLQQEMEHETAYWQEILSVKENGWSVCRIPGEAHTLGVRFGFAEGIYMRDPSDFAADMIAAHPEFRDRGMAALRKNSDGSIRLDRGPRWKGDKRLRVCLLENGRRISTNGSNPTSDNTEPPLAEQLSRARNSLFDEELFHELDREVRNLINQGVRVVGDGIRFPLEENAEVEIDLIPLSKEEQDQAQHQSDSTIPDSIAMALRILLSRAHRETYHRRTQPPPPLSETPIPRRVYPLLRPILEIKQHDSAVKAAQAILNTLKRTLSSAALSFSAAESSLSSLLPPSQRKASTVQTLLSRLTEPHHFSTTLVLPSKHTTLNLSIHTTLFPPTFGTSFSLSTLTSLPNSGVANMPQILSFPTIEKLATHLFSLTALDICSLLLLQEKEDSEDTAMEAAAGATTAEWTQPSPYQAKLVRKSIENGRQKESISIMVDGQGLHLQCVTGEGRTGGYTWRAESAEDEKDEESRNFFHVLEENLPL